IPKGMPDYFRVAPEKATQERGEASDAKAVQRVETVIETQRPGRIGPSRRRTEPIAPSRERRAHTANSERRRLPHEGNVITGNTRRQCHVGATAPQYAAKIQ